MGAGVLQPGSRVLVFGHHDLDGLVSAALVGSYIRHLGGEPDYATVDFHQRPAWSRLWQDLIRQNSPWQRLNRQELPGGVAIVDFFPTYIPESRYFLFADHHEGSLDSAEIASDTRAMVQRRLERGEPVIHDPQCGSCAELLFRELVGRNGWSPPHTLGAAAEWAHASDTAGFAHPSEAVDLRHSVLARADLVAMALTEEEAAQSIAALEQGASVQHALLELHAESSRRILQQADQALTRYATVKEHLADSVALFDFTIFAPLGSSRRIKFAEYSDPSVHYAIQLHPSLDAGGKPLVRVLLGRSPWAPALSENWRHPNLAALAREYGGGGGHPYAAGFQVTGRTLSEARAQARSLATIIASHLQPLTPDHMFADPRSAGRTEVQRSKPPVFGRR